MDIDDFNDEFTDAQRQTPRFDRGEAQVDAFSDDDYIMEDVCEKTNNFSSEDSFSTVSVSKKECKEKESYCSSENSLNESNSSEDEFSFGSDDEKEDIPDDLNLDAPTGEKFDLALLRACIANGAESLHQIEGKDVIVLLGKTGTGKSTLIQGIAGKKFTPLTYVCKDAGGYVSATKQVFDATDPIPGFDIGHAKCSMTKHVLCYESKGQNEKKFYYLDTPGFEDTNGAEVDIATSVVLAEVVKKCRSMRFVVLIHYVSLMEDRGGGMRSTLRFMRKFVDDFTKHKLSFMFLFSHTDEINTVSDSLGVARKSLLNEIILTMSETRDDDEAKEVLSFIRKSLQKNYPFVNILHPIKTNFPDLVKHIERKLKPIVMKDQKFEIRQTLTSSSQIKLTAAARKLLLNLKLGLQQRPVPIETVKDINEAFNFFKEYIDFEDMRPLIRDCNDMIREYKQDLYGVIKEQVRKGTAISANSLFSDTEVSHLKEALKHLQVIDSKQFVMQVERGQIVNAVNEFGDAILKNLDGKTEKMVNFHGCHQNLTRLYAWRGFDSASETLYNSIISRANDAIENITDYVSALEVKQLCSLTVEREILIDSFSHLSSLKTLRDNEQGLSSCLQGVEKASQVFAGFLLELRSYLETLEEKQTFIIQWDQIRNDPSSCSSKINFIVAKVQALEVLSNAIQKSELDGDICRLVKAVQRSTESQIVELFQAECLRSERKYKDGQCNDLSYLKAMVNSFSSFDGVRWKEMEFSYGALIGKVKLSITSKSAELNEMSHNANTLGIRDGVRDGEAFENFLGHLWFDAMLPVEEQFISNCLKKTRCEYVRRFETVENALKKKMRFLNSGEGCLKSRDSIEATKSIVDSFVEMVEYRKFWSKVRDEKLAVRSSESIDEIHSHVKTRMDFWESCLNRWKGLVLDLDTKAETLTKATRQLDFITSEIAEFARIPADNGDEKQQFNSIQQKRKLIMECVKSELMRIVDSESPYDVLASALHHAQIITDFPPVSQYFPSFEELKESASIRVSNQLQKIENLIDETTEYDKIDELLKDIEKASALDQYFSVEVKSRLRPLQRLRREKQVDADALVARRIANNDFSNLAEYLEPMARSKTQLRKTEFGAIVKQISDSLQRIDEDLKIDDIVKWTEERAVDVNSKLNILRDADTELGKYLKKRTYQPQKSKFLNKFRQLQEKLRLSIERSDFEEICSLEHQTEIIVRIMSDKLSKKLTKTVAENGRLINALKTSIPSLTEEFIKSSFSDSMNIVVILNKLKVVTTKKDHIFRDLSHLYSESTTSLAEGVKCLLQAVKKSALETACFEDCILVLGNLEKSFGKGMKHHIPKKLQEESNNLLEECIEAKKRQASEMGLDDILSEDSVHQWAKILDKSARKPSFWNILTLKTSYTYERLKMELENKTLQLYEHGCSYLERRDFSSLGESLKVIELVRSLAGDHVEKVSEKMLDLERRSIRSFCLLCQNAQRILRGKNYREFEQVFDDFRQFVIYVPCTGVDQDAKSKFSTTNQLVCEKLHNMIRSVENILGSFEFFEMKQVVEDVRGFGGFIADSYALFHEELKGVRHVEMDPWVEKINECITTYFQDGRDLKRIKYYATLGIVPSATKKDIDGAYRKKARCCHPDKRKGKEDEFLLIKNAHEELKLHALSDKDRQKKPFDDNIRRLGETLRETTKKGLGEQHYEYIEKLLFKLYEIEVLKTLVIPGLETEEIAEGVISLVRSHVHKVRTEVDSNWASREYHELNNNIKDLKMMEENFKSYEEVFPKSWNTGIIKKVEDEIENLGKTAFALIRNIKHGEPSRDEFRRCFLRMGAVLVELPLFKTHTKKVMSDILESCLDSNRGYSFVFELGLSLQKGADTDNETEIRIAQNLVNEFDHFREVLTMVWNEETIQKPPEETIGRIRGQCLNACPMKSTVVELEEDVLLQQYQEFDLIYTSFLGEYLPVNADLDVLIRKTIQCAECLKPVSCDDGFGCETRKVLPSIMAGIFCVFTVLKSGASYNRLEEQGTKCSVDAKKLLMKPHNIQVLTLLCMFGCGVSTSSSLKSQLLQIRTGEGKSMILGAAAVILGLLGFRVKCICYSEHLSDRDYNLFRDVFNRFGLLPVIKYSKITTLSEDTIAAKGDIRELTLRLLRQGLPNKTHPNNKKIDRVRSESKSPKKLKEDEIEAVEDRTSEDKTLDVAFFRENATHRISRNTTTSSRLQKTCAKDTLEATSDKVLTDSNNTVNEFIGKEKTSVSLQHEEHSKKVKESSHEIMLVDEVDIFFGSEFYGQTYNQVAELKEPEVASILKRIWQANKDGGKKLRLSDIKRMSEYQQLITKIPGFEYIVDNEICLMLDQVRRVEDEPKYYLDDAVDKIGYKMQDTISYNVTYGYRTIFAYLKEADEGRLRDRTRTLSRVLVMPISCGQFSYANIEPTRILGVSGTLEAMTDYEKGVLSKYGVSQYLYIPSVYSASNFSFDESGDGVLIEKDIGDYFQSITEEVLKVATKQNRAVIVFFKDLRRLQEYTCSAFFRKIGRKKEVLTENRNASEKSFIISKAATVGQITFCTAIFGRGTDFFCKDDTLESNGGVHIVQAFLSSHVSEEIQIQGRTARQGKQGTYKLVLLEKDLEDDFGIKCGSTGNWAMKERYSKLCEARQNVLRKKYCMVETNLLAAEKQDEATHSYFDSLLDSNEKRARVQLKDLYLNMKKAQVETIDLDLGFAIDATGSMSPYANAIVSTINNLVGGPNSILTKLKMRFPDTSCNIRIAMLGYRDIDDGTKQFEEMLVNQKSHFTDNMDIVVTFVKNLTAKFSGGADIAEDHLGAIERCLKWNSTGDWTGGIKIISLLTDAPAHGYANKGTSGQITDKYHVRHPKGLNVDSVVKATLEKGVDLVFCSFDPVATEQFEEKFDETYSDHALNVEGRGIVRVPLIPKAAIKTRSSNFLSDSNKHHVFVLDESGSMQYHWSGVVSVYNKYLVNRLKQQHDSDKVSVVQFDSHARVTCELQDISQAPSMLDYNGGGTNFSPAASSACDVARKTPSSHTPVIIFMSDGQARDSAEAAGHFRRLNEELNNLCGGLELHVIGFGHGTDTHQLQEIARSSSKGRVHTASDIDGLSKVFVQIAGGDVVAKVLEAEISKRISEAVTERLSAEYLG